MNDEAFNKLKGSPKNPRKMSDRDFQALKKSIEEFGDLSGIVFNVTTQQLVGGHRRLDAFKEIGGLKKVVYAWHTPDNPSPVGTIAYGHINVGDEVYNYREVAWSIERETAANIAANRIQGDWDLDLLAEANAMLAQEFPDLLELTGQTPDEINDLLKTTGLVEPSPDEAPKEPPMVIKIECDSDQQMSELFNELKERGLKVRVA